MMKEESRNIVGLLITIGDELLLGDIPNGNSRHIALELRLKGFRLGSMLTVGDAEEEIVQALSDAMSGYDFVLVTGGLGPTEDDRTPNAVSRAFARPLVPNADYESWLRSYFAQREYRWTLGAAGMALLPEGASKLIGSRPMAGFFLEHRGIPWYFLPGVPHEMRELMADRVIPDLECRFPNRMFYLKRVLRVQGFPESEIGARLEDLSKQTMEVAIGYLPQITENWVTLFTSADSYDAALERVERVEEQVVAGLGAENISSRNGEDLEVVVGLKLRDKNWRLALAESCTGGLVARRVTSVAGASDYFDRGFVTYSNEAKMEHLGVPPELLETHGAVSSLVAEAMARGARERAGVDVAVGITGIAGPTGGSEEKPVGTVFISCATATDVEVRKFHFGGSREHIREKAAQAALVLLWRRLCR